MPANQRGALASQSNTNNFNNVSNNDNNNRGGIQSASSNASSDLTIRRSGMQHYSKRLATFKDCPPKVKAQRKPLAAAGFFYTGRSDVVECAFCSGKLHKDKICDEPMAEHAKYFGGCSFVQGRSSGRGTEIKNEEEVLVVPDFSEEKVETEQILRYISHLKKENAAMRQAMTCVVCLSASVHTLLLPCQHLVCCDKCGLSAKRCPKCTGKINQKISTYMV